MSPKHLNRYVSESAWRFNLRDMGEGARVNALLGEANGCLRQAFDRMKAPRENPLGLDMPFDEALARFIGAAPSELPTRIIPKKETTEAASRGC